MARLLLALLLGLLSACSFAQTFSAGGFLKLHALSGDLSASRELRGDQELFIPHIPAAGTGRRDDTWQLHARASRLWLRASRLATPLGEAEVLVEGDLFKAYDDYRPRLRHAYVVLGRLQAGQTWSTFVNTAALADIDAGTAVGNSVTRQHLWRWTQPLGEGLNLQLALESPLNRLHTEGQAGIVSHERNSSRDIALKLERSAAWGTLSFAAVRRELSSGYLRESRTLRQQAFAFSLAGRLELAGLDNLRFMFNHGDGLARHGTLGTFPDVVLQQDSGLEPVRLSSALLAWQHYWNPDWRSTLAWSWSGAQLPPEAAGQLTRKAASAHLNLIWAPAQRWSLGVEWLAAERSLFSGEQGDLRRLQFTLRVNF